MFRCPAFLHGVRSDRVPPFRRSYQGTTTSCRPSRRTSLPSLGGTTGTFGCFRFSRRRRTPHDGPGVGHPVSPAGNSSVETMQDLPSSWGTPIPICTCSQTPVGRLATDQSTAATWPPLEERRRLQQYQTFEAQRHGFQVRCLRFAVSVTRPHARLASRCWSGSPGRAFHPQGSDERFQTHLMLVILLSQACLAQASSLLFRLGWGRHQR